METLGERLAAERRKAGKSVVDVEAGTHIRAGLIEALESGDHGRLPSGAYVRGYLQGIAKYLEIPVEPLLKLYEEETGRPAAANPVAELPADQVVPRREQAHGLPMRTAAALAALVTLVALAAWGVSRAVSGPEEPPPVPPQTTASEPTSTPEASQTPAEDDSAPAEESEPATEAIEGPRPFTLAVKVDPDAASWLVIKVDGEQAHAGTIRDGTKLTFEVTEEAVISQIGKPADVTITRDGEEVDIPDSSEPPIVTLRADDRDG